MALIVCPECGKEISDNSKKCIHCGYKIKRAKPINKKLIIIAVAIIILTVIAIVFISNNLSSDERYVYELVKDYKNKLKDPTSLAVSGPSLILSYANSEDSIKKVYFDAYANNSYGARTHSLVAYQDSEYLGDASTAVKKIDTNASESELTRQVKLTAAIYTYNDFAIKISEGDVSKYKAVFVNMKKIARKVGCGYIE